MFDTMRICFNCLSMFCIYSNYSTYIVLCKHNW